MDPADWCVERGSLLTRGRIQDLHAPVLADRDKPLAVGTVHDAGDRGRMFAERVDRAAGRQIPKPHRLISAPRGKARAVRAEGHPPDRAGVTLEGGVEQKARLGVPDLDRGIDAGRGETLAIGTEYHRADGAAMCILDGEEFVPGRR